MANSTLERDYYELADSVADYLGYDDGLLRLLPNQEDDDQVRQIKIIKKLVKSGISQVYFPPTIPGSDTAVDWSFLHPTSEIVLPEGSTGVQLPDDFGGIEGQLTIAPNVSLVWSPIPIRNEGMIRASYAQFPEMTSRPIMAAISPLRGTTGGAGQRKELLVFPRADQGYTLQCQYYVLPDMLTGAFPYLWGGAAHSETFKWSCLAMAEVELDNIPNGPNWNMFTSRLMASIAMDRKNRPQNLGANRDRSDLYRRNLGAWWHYQDTIKVNGMVPG